ncbi:uncharacterized protein [Aquarana catesbeiana]|uniref:uncharacterized protein n=1 Tax=Aquarana catesbeiana TaxID=8400 RepID=UPI003CC9CAC3
MEVKTLVPIILGVTLLVAVAEWKWNVQAKQRLEPGDLTKVIENEKETKHVLNQQEQEKTKKDKSFSLTNKQEQSRNTENLLARRKKYSILHSHLNKQLIKAKHKGKPPAHWSSHSDEHMSGSGSGFPEGSGDTESTTQTPTAIFSTTEGSGEGSGDIETTTQTVTEIFTTPEGSGDIETTTQTVTEIFTTPEGSGEGSGDIEMTAQTVTEIFTTPEGSEEGSGDIETTAQTVTEIFTTPEGSEEGSGDIETTAQTVTEIFTTPEGSEEGSGDTETTAQTVTEIFTTPEGSEEGSGDIETTAQTVTEIFTTPEGSEEGSGDIETTAQTVTEIFTTPEGSEEGSGDIETTAQTVTEIFTTPEGSGEGSGDIETTTQTVTEIFTTPEGSGAVETTSQPITEVFSTPESSGNVDTTLQTVTEIYTPEGSGEGPGEGSGDIATTSQTVTDIVTTPEESGEVETIPQTVTDGFITPEGSDIETTPQTVTEIITTPGNSGEIETTSQTATGIFTSREVSPTSECSGECSGEGSGGIETTPKTVTPIFTTPEGSGEIKTTPASVTEVFTTPAGSSETTSPLGTQVFTTRVGSGDIEKTSQTTTEKFTTQEGSEGQETTPHKVASSATAASFTAAITTSKESGEIQTSEKVTDKYTTAETSRAYTTPNLLTGESSSDRLTTSGNKLTTSEDNMTRPETNSKPEGSVNTDTTQTLTTRIPITPESSGVVDRTPEITTVAYTPPKEVIDTYTTFSTISSGIFTPMVSTAKVSVEPETGTTQKVTITKPFTTIGSGEPDVSTTKDFEKSSPATYPTLESGTQQTDPAIITTEEVTHLTSRTLTPGFVATTPRSSAINPTSSIPLTSIVVTTVSDTTTSSKTISPIITSPTTESPTTTTRPVGPTTPYCQNGGYYDGIKCICPGDYFGSFCETVLGDRVIVGTKVTATVTVEIQITNRYYLTEYQDPSSTEYKKFEDEFKKEMDIHYEKIDVYTGVQIIQIRPGSGSARKRRSADVSARSVDMFVEHNVTMEIPLQENLTVTTKYDEALKTLTDQLVMLQNCTNEAGFCISKEGLKITRVNPPTANELCTETLPPGTKEFYSPYFSTNGLTCVSDCDPLSKKYISCNTGTCQIQMQTGRACFCPQTDIYLYTYSDCKGPILKAGLYGGVGAAIAVLFLVIIIVVYFLFRRGKGKKLLDPFANDQEENWCEENDSQWHVDRGITNLSETDGDSSKNSYSSSREKFKPVLENINTKAEIKIQRPEISNA